MAIEDDIRKRRRQAELDQEAEQLEERKKRNSSNNNDILSEGAAGAGKSAQVGSSFDSLDENDLEAAQQLLNQVHGLYNQYFLGFEKFPPTQKHKALEKRLETLFNLPNLSKRIVFRVRSLNASFLSLQDQWKKRQNRIEAGTLKRGSNPDG